MPFCPIPPPNCSTHATCYYVYKEGMSPQPQGLLESSGKGGGKSQSRVSSLVYLWIPIVFVPVFFIFPGS